MMEHMMMPYGPQQPWSPWGGESRSLMPYWDGCSPPDWASGRGFGPSTGGCFGGGDFGMPRGLSVGGGWGGGFARGWPQARGAPEPGFTVNLSGEELLRALAWIPGALREAAADIESSDATRRLQSEGVARGIFGYLKGTLSAFGVDASIDAGLERRGFSVSVSCSRSALLSVADSIERVLSDSQSRGFSGGCSVSYSRGFGAIMRGLSVSCGATFNF